MGLRNIIGQWLSMSSNGEGVLVDDSYYVTTINYPISFTSVFAMGATNGSGPGPHFITSSLSSTNNMRIGSYVAQSSPAYLTSFGLRSYNMLRIKAILVGI